MLLSDVVCTSGQVSGTSSRLTKVSLIADLLRQCAHQVVDGTAPSDEIGLATRYLSGSLRQRRTGIALTSLSKLSATSGPSATSASSATSATTSPPGMSWTGLPAPDAGSVTLSELDTVMQQASELAGAGSSSLRTDLFLGLVARLTAQERGFVLGLLRGGLRQGALEAVVMTAVADAGGVPLEDVRRAVAAQGDLADVAQAVLVDGPQALDRFRLTVGRGVSPMLAGSAKSVAEALSRTGPAGVEWKLDGIRAQIHKRGKDIRVLTRSLDDITDRVPEVVELISSLPVTTAIFDGELIALHPGGRPKPFQETGSRTATSVDPEQARARTPLTAYLFDVLHLDGTDLIDETAQVRRRVLETVVPPAHLTPRLGVDDVTRPAQVDAATAFAAETVARGHEGVVVKADSAPYAMGRRGAGWIKVKPVHTLDLVILAVERGNGRRSGWLSNIHLGARDPAGRFGPQGGFVMLGKTFKGLSDDMLRWQSAELPRHAVGATDGYLLGLRPEVVVEVAVDGVQTSARYPAGLALRFARVVRHRPDKTASEADTIEMVEALHES
ncbi:MAG TPA: ATP-dependent DNA ligase [Dermatophilaceae bacterium]|nr:ATP-dependent DNA ligase [Dermatophilaceae bacterium]